MSTLNFQRLPSALPAFGKVATSRGSKNVVLTEPLVAKSTGVKPKALMVNAYRRVCGGKSSEFLPVCYPQVMAFPLHLHLMGHPQFPLAAMGMVHVGNKIEQKAPLKIKAEYTVTVTIPAVNKTSRGYEFDLVTEFTDDSGAVVWRSVSSLLSRRDAEKKSGAKKAPPKAAPSKLEKLADWTLKSGLGRRYALVSGDVNPIHLTATTAKLLGFKRAIIHGMWTLARTAASIPVDTNAAGVLTVEFKTPMFLPGKASLHGQASASGFDFEVQDANTYKPILSGSWTTGG